MHEYRTRDQWGADPALDRRGFPVARHLRTHTIFHHTVMVDDDATKNVWESVAEVDAQMRRLQTIRPDLGLDVPYNFVVFLMAGGGIIVGEGRGYDLTGAHTHGHNTAGIGVAWQGNFQLDPDVVVPYIPDVNGWLAELKRALPNVDSVAPNATRAVWGHRDFIITGCPGDHVWGHLGDFRFLESEDDDMPLIRVQRASGGAVRLSNGVSLSRGFSSPAQMARFIDAFDIRDGGVTKLSDDDWRVLDTGGPTLGEISRAITAALADVDGVDESAIAAEVINKLAEELTN